MYSRKYLEVWKIILVILFQISIWPTKHKVKFNNGTRSWNFLENYFSPSIFTLHFFRIVNFTFEFTIPCGVVIGGFQSEQLRKSFYTYFFTGHQVHLEACKINGYEKPYNLVYVIIVSVNWVIKSKCNKCWKSSVFHFAIHVGKNFFEEVEILFKSNYWPTIYHHISVDDLWK